MPVRVIVPPEPIVTPASIAGSHAADDVVVAAYIQAITEAINGPGGWLGRSLGEQTLELLACDWGDRSIRLPYGPVIEVEALAYTGSDGEEYEVDEASWSVTRDLLWLRPEYSSPALATNPWPVKVTYRAGYDGTAVAEGGTGPVPERARAAIIVAVQDLMRTVELKPGLRSETVEGIGAKTYMDLDRVAIAAKRACDALLGTLWNPSV